MSNVLFVPRGTNISDTQEGGGDKHFSHTGGDKHFYIEGGTNIFASRAVVAMMMLMNRWM